MYVEADPERKTHVTRGGKTHLASGRIAATSVQRYAAMEDSGVTGRSPRELSSGVVTLGPTVASVG